MIPVKSARHQAILDLIEQHPIDRQEDLLAHLRDVKSEKSNSIVDFCQ